MRLGGTCLKQQLAFGGVVDEPAGYRGHVEVQSYLSTAARWGITRFQALHRLFNGNGPWIPDTLIPQTTAA